MSARWEPITGWQRDRWGSARPVIEVVEGLVILVGVHLAGCTVLALAGAFLWAAFTAIGGRP